MNVRDDGARSGPVLVMLHGFAASMHWFDRMLPALAADFRVIRIDLLGHGGSPKVVPSYAPEAQARMVDAVLARLAITEAAVLGHSMGADVAIALAEQSERVSGLIVVDEGPDYSVATFPAGTELMLRPRLGRLLHSLSTDFAIRSVSRISVAKGFRMSDAFDDPRQPILDYRAMPYAAYRGCQVEKERFSTEKALDARLEDLGIPTLVVFGDADGMYRPTESCFRYRAVPGTYVEVLAGVGHSPVIEAPSALAELVREFASVSR